MSRDTGAYARCSNSPLALRSLNGRTYAILRASGGTDTLPCMLLMMTNAMRDWSLLPVRLTLGAFLVVSFVLFCADFVSWRTTHAQAPRPVIHAVHPELPYCVLLNSTETSNRLLTVTGENLTAAGRDGRVEFLEVATETVMGPFAQGVNWFDPRRITVDMGHVGVQWPLGQRNVLRVRVTSASTSEPLSNWSNDFLLADKRATCGFLRPFFPSSPIRGIAGDYWADVVIGKPDFAQIGDNNVVPFKVYNPGGVVVDRSVDPGRAYVWDSGNSRILAIDLADCYSGPGPCSAEFAIGQPSPYGHSACNGDSGVQNYPDRPPAGPTTLCGIAEHGISPGEAHTFVTMAVDSEGALYVPDSYNNRILKYENPFESDQVADQVWGQEDFSGHLCNRGDFDETTAENLCFHSRSNRGQTNWYGNGVEIDPQGNMWVADGGNNRVLRYSVDQLNGEVSKTPDLVLGQVDFASAEFGRALDKLHGPSAVRFDQDGLLYVVDTVNNRVLVFEPPFESGMQADRKFGSRFHRPTSIEIDPAGNGVWVLDGGNNMVELWDLTGTSILKILGKDSYEPTRHCGSPRWELPGSPHMCPLAGSVGIDAQGNVLVPVFLAAADVFRFPAEANQRGDVGPSFGQADRRIFYPPPNPNFKDRRGMQSTSGVVAASDQLIVSDHARLMFWNGLGTLEDGQPADGVVGDEFFVEHWPDCCGRIKADAAGRLWVLGIEGKNYLDVYELPLTEYSVPIHTIWTYEDAFPVLGTEERITLGSRIFGLAPEGNGEHLWLSDTDNHRVLRIRDPLSNPVVEVILGQGSPSGRQCNRGRFPAADRAAIETGRHNDALCFPGALSIDRLGNLFVSDHSLEVSGNRRLLVFPPSVTRPQESQAVFGPHATKAFLRSGQGSGNPWGDDRSLRAVLRLKRTNTGPLTAATWEPAFDSTNRMVVGYNAYAGTGFVGVYDDPLGPEKFPTSLLYDFGSMPYTAAFDENNNLYVGDTNRARVLLYLNPFGTPSQSSTESSASIPPVPNYPAEIKDISPEPPYCVVRHSPRGYETTLQLTVDGIGHDRTVFLQFRRITDYDREQVSVRRNEREVRESRISIDIGQIPFHHWRDREKVTMTVRVVEGDGTPLSNWTPAFLLADDVGTCGIALPTPTPTPSPTPTPTPTPTSTPTLTPTLTPSATPSPTLTPTLTPSATPSPTPTPTLTPSATPSPTLTPTLTPSATPSPTPTPTVTPSATPPPTPTPTLSPTVPSHTPTPTNTSMPTTASTFTPTPSSTPTHTATALPSPTPTPTSVSTPSGMTIPTLVPVPTHTAMPTSAPTQAASPTSMPIMASRGISTTAGTSTPTVVPTSSGGGCDFVPGQAQPNLELSVVLLFLMPVALGFWKRRR